MILAQTLGAALGIAMVILVVPNADKSNETLGVPAFGYGTTASSAFAIEALGGFFLTWIVLSNEGHQQIGRRNAAVPLALGMGMVALQLFAFPFTKAVFNPVRAFCLYLYSDTFDSDSLVYLLAPFAGSLLAAAFYVVTFTNVDVLRVRQQKRR